MEEYSNRNYAPQAFPYMTMWVSIHYLVQQLFIRQALAWNSLMIVFAALLMFWLPFPVVCKHFSRCFV